MTKFLRKKLQKAVLYLEKQESSIIMIKKWHIIIKKYQALKDKNFNNSKIHQYMEDLKLYRKTILDKMFKIQKIRNRLLRILIITIG